MSAAPRQAAEAVLRSRFYADDEFVLQGQPLIPGRASPLFGGDDRWDLGAVPSATNLAASAKVVHFEALPGEAWNLAGREYAMARTNPTHPVLQAHGLFGRMTLLKVTTLAREVAMLTTMAQWATANGYPGELSRWDQSDCDALKAALQNGTLVQVWRELGDERRLRHVSPGPPSNITVAAYLRVLKRLSTLDPVLTGGGFSFEPWGHKSAWALSGPSQRTACTTEVIAPRVWWPLVRAAWAYVDRFGTDILSARDRYHQLSVAPVDPTAPVIELLEAWLDQPGSAIPLHSIDKRHSAKGRPNWRLLAKLLGVSAGRVHTNTVLRQHVERLVGDGRGVTGGLGVPRVAVVRLDGSSGPWRDDFDEASIRYELRMLRAAAYVVIAAYSMMRDSEMQEIRRGSLVTVDGSPALVSRLHKHHHGEERTWWVIEPVKQAIGILERLSRHDEHLIVPYWSHGSGKAGVHHQANELRWFIGRINATRASTGLEEIPTERVTPHQFRRTFAVIAAFEPFAEIALGYQMKDVSSRVVASYYADPSGIWADELGVEQERATAAYLHQLLLRYRQGHTPAGPGADRLTASMHDVDQAARLAGVIGDDEAERALLRRQAVTFYPGTVNDCMFEPTKALCLKNVAAAGRQRPLLSMCQPGRCSNSIIEITHRPMWASFEDKLEGLLDHRGISPGHREVLEAELGDVRRVLDELAQP